jgi:hypothetical protein
VRGRPLLDLLGLDRLPEIGAAFAELVPPKASSAGRLCPPRDVRARSMFRKRKIATSHEVFTSYPLTHASS